MRRLRVCRRHGDRGRGRRKRRGRRCSRKLSSAKRLVARLRVRWEARTRCAHHADAKGDRAMEGEKVPCVDECSLMRLLAECGRGCREVARAATGEGAASGRAGRWLRATVSEWCGWRGVMRVFSSCWCCCSVWAAREWSEGWLRAVFGIAAADQPRDSVGCPTAVATTPQHQLATVYQSIVLLLRC